MRSGMMAKERDTGSRPGDRQPAHEGGREGRGTRPSGTDAGKGKGSDKGGGKKK